MKWLGLAWLGVAFIIVDEIGSWSMCAFGNDCFTMRRRSPCKRWAFCLNSTGDFGHCCTLLQKDLWSASSKHSTFPSPVVAVVVVVVVVVVIIRIEVVVTPAL